MQKLSMEQIQELLAEAPEMIRKLASERDHFKSLYETRVRREDAEKIASEMVRKGLESASDYEGVVSRIEKAAEQGKLDIIRAAVDMVGPDMGTKMAQLAGDGEQRITAGSSEFERFIANGLG